MIKTLADFIKHLKKKEKIIFTLRFAIYILALLTILDMFEYYAINTDNSVAVGRFMAIMVFGFLFIGQRSIFDVKSYFILTKMIKLKNNGGKGGKPNNPYLKN